MPRLSYPDASSPELVSISDRIISARGGLLDIYRLLMHSPPIASGWLELLTSVRDRITLPPDLRELIIIRIALLNDAPYEARQHIPIALESGVSGEQIAALQAWRENTSIFDDVAQAVLAYTDSLTRDVKVPEPIWKSVRDRFSERECLEITVLIATYNMVSRVLAALELE
jgi:AhpD family alkylhydroperoxidase